MVALAADLVGVGLHRLVAVMPVGDQQLGVGGGRLDGCDRLRVGHAPQPVAGAVAIGDVGPRLSGGGGLERRPGRALRVREEGEDRRDVRARRARQPQAVLLRAGVGALVRAHPAGTVALDTDAAEEAAARTSDAVGPGVLLGVRPDRRLRIAGKDTLQLPALEEVGRRLVDVAARAIRAREVDGDDVERRALEQRGALAVVDHVVGRSDDVGDLADDLRFVVESLQRLDVGHRVAEASSAGLAYRPRPMRTYVRHVAPVLST